MNDCHDSYCFVNENFTVPESTSPESTSPESTSPESTSPESTSPESTSPESTSPESTSPEQYADHCKFNVFKNSLTGNYLIKTVIKLFKVNTDVLYRFAY